MRRFNNLWRNLTRKHSVEDQLNDELRSYVDLLTEEKVRAGADPQTARREALIELGGIEQVKEQVRDVRAGRALENISSDLRHAWRTLFKTPLTSAVVILSLAVGIGVNTTIFSWIQAVIFSPMPGVADSGNYQFVEPRIDNDNYPGMSWPEYIDVRDRLTAFEDLISYRMAPFNVGEPGRSDRVYGLVVSGNYFRALGLTPALGRFIQPQEAARPGGDPVVVISYEFWQKHFDGAASALGRPLRVNDQMLTIIGVTPPRFQGTVLAMNFSFYAPATLAPVVLGGSTELTDRKMRGYVAMGHLKKGASHGQAQSEFTAVMRELARLYPETNSGIGGEVLPYWYTPHGPQRIFASGLAVLQGVTLLLLLAVCVNTANLMLARASTRQREIGVRLAIGAGRWRIMRLLLTENLLLAIVGSALGIAIAFWGTGALRAVPMIGALPIKVQTSVDAATLVFALLLGLACGVLFGIFPAVQLARLDPQTTLRAGAKFAGRNWLRNGLMGAQAGLALIVLVVAAMFFRNFRETRASDPGFRRDGILLTAFDLSGRNLGGAYAKQFAKRLLDRVREVPGVEAAAIATSVPLDIHGMPLATFNVEGHAPERGGLDHALFNRVSPGYFAAMGIPILAGQDFVSLDDATAPPQAIVNQEFVRRFIGTAQPIGRHIPSQNRSYTIAGVVRNSIYESFDERPTPILYVSLRDRPSQNGEIHLRTRPGNETLVSADLRAIVREIDPELNLYDVRTMNEHVDKNAFLKRIPAQMFLVLGPLLLALAAIGIYAVVAYSVAQRTTEIGVRLALGASPRRVVNQVVRETLIVVAKGAVVGLMLSLLGVVHLAHGVIVLPIFVGVPLVLMSVAAFACWVPAHRASRIDPMAALRQD